MTPHEIQQIADAVRVEILQTPLFQATDDPDLKNVTLREGLTAVIRDHIKNV